MRTLLIDPSFFHDEHETTLFESATSLFDYDVVIWDTFGTYKRLADSSFKAYMGDPSLGDAVSTGLRRALIRRRQEFQKFLALDRTLVVLADGPRTLYVDTGQKEHSGTGRNRHTTNLIEPMSVLDALPFEFETVLASGDSISAVASDFSRLLDQTEDCWSYRATLTTYPGSAAATVAGTDLVVASVHRSTQSGTVVILPALWIIDENEDDDDGDDARVGFAGSVEQKPDSLSDLDKVLLWLTSLSENEVEDRPEWFNSFQLRNEAPLAKQASKIEQEMVDLQVKLDETRAALALERERKLLLSSTDRPLEVQVQKAFEALGFTNLEAVPNRGDLRLQVDDSLVVVEVKGVSKSASEKHAAQLEKWVAAELEQGEHAKGVLVVNAWRLLRPDERKSPAFPDQMLSYAVSRDHALVTGAQLLDLVEAVRRDPSLAVGIRAELFAAKGRFKTTVPVSVSRRQPRQ